MLLLLSASQALAQTAPPVRRTRLQDGREFVAEVLGTESTGLRVRIPAGEMLVSFEDLLEVKPTESTAYASQPQWRVIVATTPELAGPVTTLFDAMAGVVARPVGEPDDGLSAAQQQALEACAGEVGCMRTAVADQPWQWIVAVKPTADGAEITSVVSTATRSLPGTSVASPLTAEELWKGLHSAIGLDAPRSAAPAVEGLSVAKKPPKPNNNANTSAASSPASPFVPIPGWTAFKGGDAGRGALGALGVVGFTAASAVGGLLLSTDGQNTAPAVQAGTFGVVGFLGSTWAVNHWLGPKAGAALVPTAQGGMVVGQF